MTDTSLLRPVVRTTVSPWLGGALLALAAGLAAVALLGPLATGAIEWRISSLVRNQVLGLDAVSLVLVAPLAACAGALTLRGNPLGPLLGLPVAFYVAYMVPQYVLGPDYLGIDGNNERAFPLMLALFVLTLLDLGIGLPAILATCLGVRRGATWARRALYAVVGSLALVGLAVAGMAVAMFLRDDPAMSAGGMTMMVVLGGALGALAAYLFAPLLRA